MGCAFVHMLFAMSATAGANGSGIWCAALATFGLSLQAFVGTNLQAPGMYRGLLRRWHTVLFWGIAFLSVLHVALNGAIALAAGNP